MINLVQYIKYHLIPESIVTLLLTTILFPNKLGSARLYTKIYAFPSTTYFS